MLGDDIALALNPPTAVRRRRGMIRLGDPHTRVWPLATIDGRAPVLLEGRAKQRGVELAYARLDGDEARYPIGTSIGTPTHVLPPMTPAHAIGDAVIRFAGRLGHGFGLILDHGDGWASHYANLQTLVAIRTDLYRPAEQRVRAGDVIGYVGALEPDAFKRLYFELWKRDLEHVFAPIDARPHLATWRVLDRQATSRPEAA